MSTSDKPKKSKRKSNKSYVQEALKDARKVILNKTGELTDEISQIDKLLLNEVDNDKITVYKRSRHKKEQLLKRLQLSLEKLK